MSKGLIVPFAWIVAATTAFGAQWVVFYGWEQAWMGAATICGAALPAIVGTLFVYRAQGRSNRHELTRCWTRLLPLCFAPWLLAVGGYWAETLVVAQTRVGIERASTGRFVVAAMYVYAVAAAACWVAWGFQWVRKCGRLNAGVHLMAVTSTLLCSLVVGFSGFVMLTIMGLWVT
jgi:hypothetical protein